MFHRCSIVLILSITMMGMISCGKDELKPKAELAVSFAPSSSSPQQTGSSYTWTYNIRLKESNGIDIILETAEFNYYDHLGQFKRTVIESCDFMQSVWDLANCTVRGDATYNIAGQTITDASPNGFSFDLTVTGRDEFGHAVSATSEFTALSY
jgi:hypothetical protein